MPGSRSSLPLRSLRDNWAAPCQEVVCDSLLCFAGSSLPVFAGLLPGQYSVLLITTGMPHDTAFPEPIRQTSQSTPTGAAASRLSVDEPVSMLYTLM